MIKRYEEYQLTQDIQHITSTSEAFNFVHTEEDLYSEADLKEVYDGQG